MFDFCLHKDLLLVEYADLQAPPKGATLSYRPKPTFNPLLIASSAAAIANAQAQQLTTAALLQNIPQGAAAAFLPQQFPGVIPGGEVSHSFSN